MLTPAVKRILPILAMLIFPFLGALYHWVNQPGPDVYSLMTSVDNGIPFVRFFVVPYSIWIFFIYICVIYFLIKDVSLYYKTLLVYTLCVVLCCIIYSVFQTTVPRPTLVGNDIFTQLTLYVYNRDLPYNCFPSIHCFSCYLVMKAIYKSTFKNNMNQILIYSTASIIIMSTVFIKQHAILDVIAAILLVELVYLCLSRFKLGVKATLNEPNKVGEVYQA